MRSAATLALLIVALATPANAAHRHRSHDPMVNMLAYGFAQMLHSERMTYEPYRHRRYGYAHQRARHRHYGRSYGHGSLPGPCYEAARKGGPCGCTAESIIFGTTAHVLNGLNLWLARTWHVFETASPSPGMAAIWGNHHVEAIVSNVHNGHFTTSGPYGYREVRVGSVRVVNPHGGHVASYARHRHRYAYRRRHWRYARAW